MRLRFGVIFGAMILCTPIFTGALTTDELRTQIQSLLDQVNALQQQLGSVTTTTTATSGGAACVTINANLQRGSRGAEVLTLQQFLIAQGLLLSDSATSFFGSLTESAVQKWQASQNIVSSGSPSSTGWGVVGPKTRAALAACGSSQVGGAIQVSPLSGNPPLQVTINARVNTTHSCVAATYMLDYGDGSSNATINTPSGACGEIQQTFTHNYANQGVYLVTLSSGGHKTSATVTVGGAQTVPLQTSVATSFNVPGTVVLAQGQAAVSGTFSIRLDQIQSGTSVNGALVPLSAYVTASDGSATYQPALQLNAPTVIGGYLVTATSLQGSSVTLTVSPYTGSSATQSGFSLVPGANNNLLSVSIQFWLASSCSAYDVSWGDSGAHSTQAQNSCAASAGTKTLVHTYSTSGTYAITVKRGANLDQIDTATIAISN